MMRGNIFGNLLTLTTFGESHGPAMGAVVDGCPAGILLDEADFRAQLERRRPGQSVITSGRQELDAPQILSGVFGGETLGTPICVVVRNRDARSQDYDPNFYRAGHADRVWEDKFGRRDYRGGGRASGRETLSRVIGGVIAEKILPEGVRIVGFTRRIGELKATQIPGELTRAQVDQHPTRCPDPGVAGQMQEMLELCKKEGDSRGGVVELWIDGLPSGLGEPVFGKAKSLLCGAMMGVGAVVGCTLGDAFEDAQTSGVNFHRGISGDGPRAGISPAANGIQGGITNGERVRLLVYFKPPSTTGSMARAGRHDPCIIPRAIPVLESMAALVLADLYLNQRLNRAD